MSGKITVVSKPPKLERKKRVAAYARVSSGKDAMLHSLSAQVSYYNDHIQNHGDWLYAGVYSDKIKPDMPFGDWIDFWYQTYCRHTLRITTRTDYENRIYNHIIPEIGKIPLNRLSQSDLQQFYAKEKTDGRKLHAKTYGKGLSDRTIRGIHANCRTALQRAVQEGLIRTNPAVGCKLPPKKARRYRC